MSPLGRSASVIAIAGFIFGGVSWALAAPPHLDVNPKDHPPLNIKNDKASHYPNGTPAAFRGFADPCIRKDPASNTLYMLYSWPHMEYLGPRRTDFATGVETHAAYSTDGGKSWQRDNRVLWPKTPVKWTDPKTKETKDGFLSHEVPNFVPCQVEGSTIWVAARLDYFLARQGNYKARDNRSFCLRIMAAPGVRELAHAKPITLGHDGSSPDCAVTLNVCTLSDDFPSVFIPNEPALYAKDGRLYLAFVVMAFRGATPDFAKSFIAVLCTEPKGEIDSWRWKYLGKLATHAQAKELAGEALTQIDLATAKDGKLVALLTPEAWNDGLRKGEGEADAFYGITHKGCTVVEVASLDVPALARNGDGTLAVRAVLTSSVQGEHGPGAAGYDAASDTGILLTLRGIEAARELVWTLHPTRLHP